MKSLPHRRCASPRLLPSLLGLVLAPTLLAPSALEAQEARPWKATTDVGVVSATGNTDVSTVNVGEEVLFTGANWGLKQTFGVVYGRTDGEVSTSLWRGALRGDRRVGERIGVYLLGAFDRNTFAGVSRRFEEGVGLVLRLMETPRDRLELEGGGGFTQQRSTAGESDSFANARAAGSYRRSFGERSYGQLSSEFLPNLEESGDYRLNAGAELVAPLSESIAMKFSYQLRYDNAPEPGFGTTDRLLTAGVQVTF